jgi:hypothetical protein
MRTETLGDQALVLMRIRLGLDARSSLNTAFFQPSPLRIIPLFLNALTLWYKRLHRNHYHWQLFLKDRA